MTEGIKKINRFLGSWALSLCGGILVMAAGLHRLQLGTPSYSSSPLIQVEMILMLLVALLVFVHLLSAVVLLFKRRWRRLLIAGINTVAGIAAWLAAMSIDAPTLIYMT